MKRYFLIVILSIVVLSACVSEAEQMPTATSVKHVNANVEQEITETPLPEPTDTLQPEVENTREVVEPTATETPTLTVTVNPFAAAHITSYWYINDRKLMITIEVPGGVPVGEFTAMVESAEYSCEVLPDYPDRLFCSGPALPGGERALVTVLTAENRMFEGSFTVPEFGSLSIAEEESNEPSVPAPPVPPETPPPFFNH